MRLLTHKIWVCCILGVICLQKFISKLWEVSVNKTLKKSVLHTSNPHQILFYFASNSSSLFLVIHQQSLRFYYCNGGWKSMAYFLSPNVQLDHFDSTNFTCWKEKLFFLLTVLKITYVLDPNFKPLLELNEDDSDQVKIKK